MRFGLTSILTVVVTLLAFNVSATPVVVPSYLENVEGNSNNCYPLSCTNMRYQQIYDASLFAGNNGIIDEILFRLDANASSGFSTIYDIEMTFSHFDGAVSSVFANNLGSDATLVLDDSAYAAAGSTSSTAPNPFNIIFDVADTFVYDGVRDLLVDIKIFSGSSNQQFDAHYGDSGLTRIASFGASSATSGGIGSSYGLVTAFNFQPVPAPAPLALFGLGLLALGIRRKHT